LFEAWFPSLNDPRINFDPYKSISNYRNSKDCLIRFDNRSNALASGWDIEYHTRSSGQSSVSAGSLSGSNEANGVELDKTLGRDLLRY